MVVITENNRDIIIDAVKGMYTELARRPDGEFHFAKGRVGCEHVGYSAEELGSIPSGSVESFAGVGYPFQAGVIRTGDDVLDVGSGSGTDALLASLLVGPTGTVQGLDMTAAMRAKLERCAAEMGAENVSTIDGNAEDIPLADASIDVVTSNGVLNLVPDKAMAIREIFRVLRPGGRVQISDIVVDIPPSDACKAQPQLWAECIVGAVGIDLYRGHLTDAGFEDIEILETVDYFDASPSEETEKVASSFGAHAVVLTATKPA
jgi:SAM-dependent methyltransferase